MRIINKETIDRAGEYYATVTYGVPKISCDQTSFDNGREDFVNGAIWAKSKYEELFTDIITENQGLKLYKDNESDRFKNVAIEFLRWHGKNDYILQDVYENQRFQDGYKYQKWSNVSCEDVTEENSYFDEELFKHFLKQRDEKT